MTQSERISIAVRKRIAAGTWWNPFGNTPWTAEHKALLGTITDARVAAITGRSEEVVRCRRNALGIPPVTPYHAWTDEEDDLLGTMPDHDLSKKIGRSYSSVNKRRRRLGIENYKPAWK